MIRPTKAQIDAKIIDQAADLFARHGFSHTSLQQIADATGYSKPGLLHYFPSKKAIYAAALALISNGMEEIVDAIEKVPLGIERDRLMVELWVDFTIENPGISALSNRIAIAPESGELELQTAGRKLLQALGIDVDNLQLDQVERMVQLSIALTGLGLVTMAMKDVAKELRAQLIAAAMNAMGHSV